MITFKELEANYESVTAIPYFELIKTKEWFDCRVVWTPINRTFLQTVKYT